MTYHSLRLAHRLDEVAKMIDEKIREFSGANGVFVRLSSRSPKDVCDYTLYETYLHDLAAMKREEGGSIKNSEEVEANPVFQKIAFTRASCNVLKSTTGLNAVKLFLNSQRVFEDLTMATSLYDSDDTFQMQVVVRRWENIRQEWEFRAFVFDGVLTACSQYYSGVFVPKLAANKEQYKQRIVSFWEASVKSVMEDVGVSTYVVDFVLDPTNTSRDWIVEINNPPPIAGAGLYDWDIAEDREIIEKAKAFDFRVLMESPEEPMKAVAGWLSDMQKKRAEKMKRTTTSATATSGRRRPSF